METSLNRIHAELGISEAHLAANKLPACEQPSLASLEVVDIDFNGRPFVLTKSAAEAWKNMLLSARRDGLLLEPISGFRSYIYQKQLIEKKLSEGRALDIILTETAIPGFSEHHTGCAIDISSDGNFRLSQDFEQTQAFNWLLDNAERFHFKLSYPRNNEYGIVFEPWHWCFQM